MYDLEMPRTCVFGLFRPHLLHAGLLAAYAAAGFSASPPTVFKITMRRTSGVEWQRMIERGVDLIFNDDAATLQVETHQGGAIPSYDEAVPSPFAVRYDDIARVLLETTTQPNGGPVYWFYFEHKPGGSPERFLLRADDRKGVQVAAKIGEVFGARVVHWESQPLATVGYVRPTAQTAKCSSKERRDGPAPEIRPGQALLMVVCPGINAARHTGGSGPSYRLVVDGHEVASNQEGRYSLLYLDPGEHVIASGLGANLLGVRLALEAGKDYYFFQDPEQRGALSPRSKEVAIFETSGSLYKNACPVDTVRAAGPVDQGCATGALPQGPRPGAKPGQALLLVVRPPDIKNGQPFQLMVDARPLAANSGDGYSFAYVDPGVHLLLSGPEMHALGFTAKAGHEYYFTQDPQHEGSLVKRTEDKAMFEAAVVRNCPDRVAPVKTAEAVTTRPAAPVAPANAPEAAVAVPAATAAPPKQPEAAAKPTIANVRVAVPESKPVPPLRGPMPAAGVEASVGGGLGAPMIVKGGRIHPAALASIAVNTSSPLQVAFEGGYWPTSGDIYGSFDSCIYYFGAGAQYRYRVAGTRTELYLHAIGGEGFGRVSEQALSYTSSSSTPYIGGGGGLRYYLGHAWGLRPEVRFQHYFNQGYGNVATLNMSFFFQIAK
jgi:hypothetical protein